MLPCKPYVAHYLKNTFGPQIELSRASNEGKMLFNLLSRARHEKDNEQANYTHQVSILLAEGIYLRHGWELTPTAITEFNNFIETELKTRFMVHVDALLAYGIKKAVAIRSFQDMYGFNEDVWKYETLKKYHDRQEKKRSHLKRVA